MKVFILKFYDGNYEWIQGIYSSKELAEKYREEREDWAHWGCYSILEYGVVSE